jgi:hypothetical protein
LFFSAEDSHESRTDTEVCDYLPAFPEMRHGAISRDKDHRKSPATAAARGSNKTGDAYFAKLVLQDKTRETTTESRKRGERER